jgi:uncharacterized membrane protein
MYTTSYFFIFLLFILIIILFQKASNLEKLLKKALLEIELLKTKAFTAKKSDSPPIEQPQVKTSAAKRQDIQWQKPVPEPKTTAAVKATARPQKNEQTDNAISTFIKDFFTKGNVVVKVGVVILFFGISFLIKYAASQGYLPVHIRLILIAALGVVLTVVGWRLRTKDGKQGFALVLQGAGLAIFYLDIFAAFRLFEMISGLLALILLVVTVIASVFLSVRQDSKTLAIFGLSGGFIAPILTSTGNGSHVALFSFYALLNAGIFAIAWFKTWRFLNVLGFIFTFGIGSIWGLQYYKPEHFTSVEPFLILFFLFYTIIAVLFAMKQKPNLKGFVDGILVFGTPLIVFSLQSGLVMDFNYGLAWSAFTLGAFYLVLATILKIKLTERYKDLFESFLALGIGFLTLTIPLAFDARWTSALWVLEGAGLVWIGVRQSRVLSRCFGSLLILSSGFLINEYLLLNFTGIQKPFSDITIILNSAFLGCFIKGIAALFAAHSLNKGKAALKDFEVLLEPVLTLFGLFWWFFGGIFEIYNHVPDSHFFFSCAIFITLSLFICELLRKRFEWRLIGFPNYLLLPLLYLFLLLTITQDYDHPLQKLGIIAWPLAIFHLYFVLKRFGSPIMHTAALWLVTALFTWEVSWQIDQLAADKINWVYLTWCLVPALVILLVTKLSTKITWPLKAHCKTYMTQGLGFIVIYCLGWAVFNHFLESGNVSPLPYLPILNPIDAVAIFTFFSIFTWLKQVNHHNYFNLQESNRDKSYIVIVFFVFLWVNAVLIRSIHQWFDVPFTSKALYDSLIVQMSLSIYWCLIGMGVMVLAARKKWRSTWITGATLLGIVVLKLIFVDYMNRGSLEQTVSTIVVGVLFVITGYFSPIPPSKTT